MTRDIDVRVVIGPPGTGKTSHIATKAGEAAERFGGERVVIASLTRAAAAEVHSRQIPIPKENAGTLHSLAYRAVGRPRLVDTKAAAAWSEEHPAWALSGLKDAHVRSGEPEVGGEDEDDEDSQEKPGNRLLALSTLMRSQLIPRGSWTDPEAEEFDEAWERWKRENEVMDFEDMIQTALADAATAPNSPRVIYLDEAQDHSPAEVALALKWGRAAGSLVAVGDADQTIYTFRGANPDAFMAMAKPEHRRVLEQSYRVPRAVHAYAVDWIEGLEGRERITYLPRDSAGEVLHEPGLSYNVPGSLVDAVQEETERGRTVLVVAQCSFMIDPIKRALRADAVPFHNPLRVRRGDWNPLRGARRVLDYLAPCRATWGDSARAWTYKRLWSWLEFVHAKLLVDGAKSECERLAKTERTAGVPIADTPEASVEALGAFFADGVLAWDGDPATLRSLLLNSKRPQMEYPIAVAEKRGTQALRETPRLAIGTVHSYKGGEADVVYVLPNVAPSARREWESGEETALRRLFYVAFTRAREKLVICGEGGNFPGVIG